MMSGRAELEADLAALLAIVAEPPQRWRVANVRRSDSSASIYVTLRLRRAPRVSERRVIRVSDHPRSERDAMVDLDIGAHRDGIGHLGEADLRAFLRDWLAE